MNQNYAHPLDLMEEIECRAAFLSRAVGAFACVDDAMLPDNKAWRGFHFLTLDMQELIEKGCTMAANI